MLLILFLFAVVLVLLFLGLGLDMLMAPDRRGTGQQQPAAECRGKPRVRSRRRPVIIGPCVVIGPSAPAVIIEPPPRAAWEDRGWEVRHEGAQTFYQGYYRVADRRGGRKRQFTGTILVNSCGVLPYIADPPAELRRHPKSPCFQLCQPPWFKVHWEHPARNVDDALLYIEKVLDEAVNGRRVR